MSWQGPTRYGSALDSSKISANKSEPANGLKPQLQAKRLEPKWLRTRSLCFAAPEFAEPPVELSNPAGLATAGYKDPNKLEKMIRYYIDSVPEGNLAGVFGVHF